MTKKRLIVGLIGLVAVFGFAVGYMVMKQPAPEPEVVQPTHTAPTTSDQPLVKLKEPAEPEPKVEVIPKSQAQNKPDAEAAAVAPAPEPAEPVVVEPVLPAIQQASVEEPPPVEQDPVEIEAFKREMFEVEALQSLPLLTVQTHSPYWDKEDDGFDDGTASDAGGGYASSSYSSGSTGAAGVDDGGEGAEGGSVADGSASGGDQTDSTQTDDQDRDSETSEGNDAPEEIAVELDEDGPFGRIGPPDGQVWIRIQPEYASQHKEIMAQTADLYRTETGHSDTVTVMLWVGGRPYARHSYD